MTGTGSTPRAGGSRSRVDEPSLVIVAQSGYANIAIWRDLLAADARVRAGRSPAAVPAGGREHARPDRLAGPQLLRGPLPRGHVPRLPADVGSGGERRRAAAPARPRAPRCRRRSSRRSPASRGPRASTRARRRAWLARAAQARSAGPAGRAVPGRAHARPQRRPRQHHRVLGCAGRRVALPALDVRRAAGTASTSPRSATATTARPARRPLRRDARRRRHELRRADQGGPDRRHVPAHAPRRPSRRRRGPATRAGRAARRAARSPPRPWPTRSSAGGSTTAARAAGCAAGAGATRATTPSRSRSTARSSRPTSPCAARRRGTSATGAVRADLRIGARGSGPRPRAGTCSASWRRRTLDGTLGGRTLRAVDARALRRRDGSARIGRRLGFLRRVARRVPAPPQLVADAHRGRGQRRRAA